MSGMRCAVSKFQDKDHLIDGQKAKEEKEGRPGRPNGSKKTSASALATSRCIIVSHIDVYIANSMRSMLNKLESEADSLFDNIWLPFILDENVCVDGQALPTSCHEMCRRYLAHCRCRSLVLQKWEEDSELLADKDFSLSSLPDTPVEKFTGVGTLQDKGRFIDC